MAGDSFPESGYARTAPEIDAAYARSKVDAGDLVVAIRATVGKVLPVPQHLVGANLTQGTAKISPGRDVDGRFLLGFLRSNASQQRFEALAKGATFREITLDMLRRFKVPVPPIRDQVDIVACLEREAPRIDVREGAGLDGAQITS
jgi:type I restriction enzyme S subunit